MPSLLSRAVAFSVAALSNAVHRSQDRKPLPIADGSQLAVAVEFRQSYTRGTKTAFSVPLVRSSVILELDSLPFEMNPLSEAIVNVKAKWSAAGTGSLRMLLVMTSWAIWAAPFALNFEGICGVLHLSNKTRNAGGFCGGQHRAYASMLKHFAIILMLAHQLCPWSTLVRFRNSLNHCRTTLNVVPISCLPHPLPPHS